MAGLEELQALADQLASEDLSEARVAEEQLRARLTPEGVVELWQAPESPAVVTELLRQCANTGDERVCEVLAGVLTDAVCTPPAPGVDALFASGLAGAVVDFLLDGLCGDSLRVACGPCRLALVRVCGATGPTRHAAAVAAALERRLRGEHVLRLFDCDAPAAEENRAAHAFLRERTTLIDFIVDAALEAYDTDVLVLGNYLAACGVVSRFEAPAPRLTDKVARVLRDDGNTIAGVFTYDYCAAALTESSANATAFGVAWCEACARNMEGCDTENLKGLYSVFAALVTTADGAAVLLGEGRGAAVARHLSATLTATPAQEDRKLCALLLTGSLLRATALPDDFFTCDTAWLGAVWALRSNIELLIRREVWCCVRAAVERPALRTRHAQLYASYLCGEPKDHTSVREEQLAVAQTLLSTGTNLPDQMKDKLLHFKDSGLYFKGSSGVETLSK